MNKLLSIRVGAVLLVLGFAFLAVAQSATASEVLYSMSELHGSDSVDFGSPHAHTTDVQSALNAPQASSEGQSVAEQDNEDMPAAEWQPAHGRSIGPGAQIDATNGASVNSSSSFSGATVEAVLQTIVPNPLANVASGVAGRSKWIDINISRQTITAYLGSTPVKTVLVSTGTLIHPTVIGRYRVYAKIPSQTMTGGSRARGDYYRLPGVPNIMYFYQGYGIHGTYWHHNFGHRMSHGCVNLTLSDARWFYNWTPMGTLVVTHN